MYTWSRAGRPDAPARGALKPRWKWLQGKRERRPPGLSLHSSAPVFVSWGMGEARGHHFVSQCYLKRFTHNGSKKSKLWVCDLGTGTRFQTAPANVAKQRDFNLIEGLPHGELEGRLSIFEGSVDGALDTIEVDRSLKNEDAWVHVLNLTTLFAVRNPRLRESMHGFQEQIATRLVDLMLSTPQNWESQKRQAMEAGYIDPNTSVTYAQMKDFHERGEYTIKFANATHIATEFHVFEPVLKTMVARKWNLFVAEPESGDFITSDHPVCLMPMDPLPTGSLYGVGYGMAKTMVYFPITRNIAAIGTFEDGGNVVSARQETVAQLNTPALHHATRQVFAPDGNAPVIGKGGSITSIGDAAAMTLAFRGRG